jgi:hypothetical protein
VAKKPLLSNGLYDILKKTTTLVLPAFATLYFALAKIWGLPAANEVMGTVAAVVTFLGGILHISSTSYNNSDVVNGKYVGDLVVKPHPEDPNVSTIEARLNETPTAIASMSEAAFKVQHEQE